MTRRSSNVRTSCQPEHLPIDDWRLLNVVKKVIGVPIDEPKRTWATSEPVTKGKSDG